MNLKNFFCAAMLAVMFFMPHETFAESATEKLVQIEKDTYGEESTGAILDRISRLEKDFFGENLQKNMNARIESIYDSLYENIGEPGVIAKVNALEWNVNREVNGGGIEARISDLEKKILGKEQKGSFSERIRELSKATFGDENIPMTQTQLPANTLVKGDSIDTVEIEESNYRITYPQAIIIHFDDCNLLIEKRWLFSLAGFVVRLEPLDAENFGLYDESFFWYDPDEDEKPPKFVQTVEQL